MNKIQITGNEENKERACGFLMRDNIGTVHCLPDEIYVICDEDLKRLEIYKVRFEILQSGNSIVHDTEDEIEKPTNKMKEIRDKAEKELRRIRP